jgi:hypothetical protein
MVTPLETLREIYENTFARLDPSRQKPLIDVRYYPYIGINHTIRVRNGRVFVRVSEICSDMPLAAQQGLADILVSKLLRKRIPQDSQENYARFIRSREIRERASARRREHGRKVITAPNGSIYDLNEIFDRLNTDYFKNAVPKPVLTWSARPTYRILGHHDSTHDTIVISRSLDSADVPRYVVEHVVFHEMLHIVHPTRHQNGRRFNHTPAFRLDERKFAHFREAESWIERNVRRLKRNIKRSRTR